MSSATTFFTYGPIGPLIASQLVGFALLRYVWKIEPIASMPDDEVVAAMAPTLQRYVDGDIGGRGSRDPA